MPDEKAKTFTLKEIADHSSNESTWLLIDNSVYDVTKFLEEHPGGPEPLLDWAGKEATEAFEDIGHSTDARTLMKEYKIGELCKEDQASTSAKPASSRCLYTWILVPVGITLCGIILYQVYARLKK